MIRYTFKKYIYDKRKMMALRAKEEKVIRILFQYTSEY